MRDAGDYEGLKKLPQVSAGEIIAPARVNLTEPLDDPRVPLAEALRELAGRELLTDALTLWAHALLPRERVWWACLAARDLLADRPETEAVRAAEAWVYRPCEVTRAAARAAAESPAANDDTFLCAMAANFADGTLGPGEHAHFPAPPGAAGGAAAAMAILAYLREGPRMAENGELLIFRALDIARGGNGRAGLLRGAAGADAGGVA